MSNHGPFPRCRMRHGVMSPMNEQCESLSAGLDLIAERSGVEKKLT